MRVKLFSLGPRPAIRTSGAVAEVRHPILVSPLHDYLLNIAHGNFPLSNAITIFTTKQNILLAFPSILAQDKPES